MPPTDSNAYGGVISNTLAVKGNVISVNMKKQRSMCCLAVSGRKLFGLKPWI